MTKPLTLDEPIEQLTAIRKHMTGHELVQFGEGADVVKNVGLQLVPEDDRVVREVVCIPGGALDDAP